MQWTTEPFDDGSEAKIKHILKEFPKYATEPFDDGKEATIKVKFPIVVSNPVDDGEC